MSSTKTTKADLVATVAALTGQDAKALNRKTVAQLTAVRDEHAAAQPPQQAAPTQQADKKPTQKPQKATKPASQPKPSPKPQKAAQPKAKGNAKAEPVEQVQFYRLRKSGTARHLPVLAAGSPERAQAQAVAKRIAKGETATQVGEDLCVSVSTVRRQVAALEFTEQVEAGKFAALIKKAKDGKVYFPANAKEEQA